MKCLTCFQMLSTVCRRVRHCPRSGEYGEQEVTSSNDFVKHLQMNATLHSTYRQHTYP